MDLRKEARYPDEIGVRTGEKGFISISKTFTMRILIEYGYTKVKGKSKTFSKRLNTPILKSKQKKQNFILLKNSLDHFSIV